MLPNKRTGAFYYTTLTLIGLLIAAYWFLTSTHAGFLSGDNVRFALIGGWWAMVGGVAIGYKGIVDHRRQEEWTNGWLLWYIVRPYSSFVVGLVTYSLLRVASGQTAISVPALAVAAFVFGTQERRFFGFLTQVAQLVLTPNEPTGLQVTSISPESGPAGAAALLLIEGQGFQPNATVTVGGQAMVPPPVVASDGASLAGSAPARPAGAADVVVINPDNTAQRAPKPFTYT